MPTESSNDEISYHTEVQDDFGGHYGLYFDYTSGDWDIGYYIGSPGLGINPFK